MLVDPLVLYVPAADPADLVAERGWARNTSFVACRNGRVVHADTSGTLVVPDPAALVATRGFALMLSIAVPLAELVSIRSRWMVSDVTLVAAAAATWVPVVPAGAAAPAGADAAAADAAAADAAADDAAVEGPAALLPREREPLLPIAVPALALVAVAADDPLAEHPSAAPNDQIMRMNV